MEQCTKSENCVIAQDPSLKPKSSSQSYAELYCNSNKSTWINCRRYLYSESVGGCPDFLLPDMVITDDEIIRMVEV